MPADVCIEVKGNVSSGTIDHIRSASSDLTQALQWLGGSIYAQQEGPKTAPGGGSAAPEGTVEGEFREI